MKPLHRSSQRVSERELRNGDGRDSPSLAPIARRHIPRHPLTFIERVFVVGIGDVHDNLGIGPG